MTDGLSAADILDIVAFAAVSLGCLFGLIRGLSGELARFAAIFGAFAAFRIAGPAWQSLCASWFGSSGFLFVLITAIGSIATAALGGWLVRKLVDKCLRLLVPQPLNSILGGLFGALVFFLLAAAICLLLSLFPIQYIRETLLGTSRFWKIAAPLISLGRAPL